MSTPQSTNPQDYYLDGLSEIIREIVEKSGNGACIFRGEPETYDDEPFCGKVSSTLYRMAPNSFDSGKLELAYEQDKIINELNSYLPVPKQNKGFEIWTELQHYGTETNLIDFTTDYHIALFFACNGSHDKDGRVIIFSRTDSINQKYHIKRPHSPENRVLAQKSIFAQPPKGYLDFGDYTIVSVPANLKQWFLIHLRKFQDVSTQSVYNDIHGFIRHRTLRLSPTARIPRETGLKIMIEVPERDPVDEEAKKKLLLAIKHHTSGLQYAPYDASFYTELSYCYFLLDDISRAIETLSKAIWADPNYESAYYMRARCYTVQRDNEHALADLKTVIDFDSKLAGKAHYRRGMELLHSKNWEAAKSDFIAANAKLMHIRFQFAADFHSVAHYEHVSGVKLPKDISELLQPEQPP
ncbi:MAG: FRG domain-containing protein [Candidatus Poribacteria bacterium]|nr:FRG domain-containing protein [Candidatus Poribacteria bacterium]